MKFLALIQNEFLQLQASSMFKTAKKQSLKSFDKEMGEKRVSNPSSKRDKTRTIKIKSLKSGDERQKGLYKQLYKQWKGSKTKKVDTKKQKAKLPKKHLTQLKKEFEDKKKQLKPKKKSLSEAAKYRKYLENRKNLELRKKKKLPEKSKVVTNANVPKEQKEEIKADELQQKLQVENEQRLKAIGDKTDNQYKTTIETVKKNESQIYRDASNLSDPAPPDPQKLKNIQQYQESLDRALKAMDVGDAQVSDVVNSPNVVTYKLSLKQLLDKDKAKAMHKLLSSESKTVMSHFIGKKENVTITENRDTDTIDVHVPKGTDLRDRDPVSFKELITNDAFVKASKDPTKLPIAFGKDENNNTITYDFSKTPHLIVSGATKSGKSVFNQSIINSIQMGKSPDEAKMILIDAAKQGAEFAQYKDSEYLDRPIAANAKEAEESLQALSDEVNRRNNFFKNTSGLTGMSFRNIEDWNSFIAKQPEQMNDSEKKAFDLIPAEQRKKMHRIVTIVDEAKDLFNKEVNPNAARLFNLVDHMLTVARSVGAHMVIATQSPAKQNIPGKIQANIGAKMTFRLQNKSDAENIGVSDATDLLMYGDGYFEDPSIGGAPTRLQTGFIDKNDDAKITSVTRGEQKFIEKEKKPELPTVQRFKATDDPVYIEFQKQMAGVREKLNAQRERLEGRSKELDANIDKIRAQREELQKRREERQKQLEKTRSDQTDIKRQKERTPSDIDVAEQPEQPEETDIDQLLADTSKGPETKSEPDISDKDAVRREIDEITKPEPVKEPVKSNDPFLKKIREDAAKKKMEPKKKSMLDRIKTLLGKK